MKSLLIGFSYSLASDGAPGNYNLEIAHRILTDLEAFPKDQEAEIYAQWEIFDALSSIVAKQHMPDISPKAIPPPIIEAKELAEPQEILDFLEASRSPATSVLLESIATEFENEIELSTLLNHILSDKNWFKSFQGKLDIPDLRRWIDPPNPRPELGLLGLEKRRLPHSEDYPKGLARYQAIRVNRLIMETILPERLLKRGQYLGVAEVIRQIFANIEVASVDTILVYGHPVHQDWCLKLTREYVKRNWPDVSVEIEGAKKGDDMKWDAQTAQVWCRSLENWQAYIGIKKG